jgi:hypothetical protein
MSNILFALCLFNEAVRLCSLVFICLLTVALGGGFKEGICDTISSFTWKNWEKHAKFPLYSMLLPSTTQKIYTAKFFGFKQQISVKPDMLHKNLSNAPANERNIFKQKKI